MSLNLSLNVGQIQCKRQISLKCAHYAQQSTFTHALLEKNYKYDWILHHREGDNTSWVILHNMLGTNMFFCSIWERGVEEPAPLMAGFWFLRYKFSLLHWMLSFSLLFLRKSRMLLKSAPSVLFTYNDGRRRHKDNMFDRCAYQTRKRSTSEELWCWFFCTDSFSLNRYTMPLKSV